MGACGRGRVAFFVQASIKARMDNREPVCSRSVKQGLKTLSPELTVEKVTNTMTQNLRELWNRRELVYWLAVRTIKARYAQKVLGFGWAIIQPLATAVIFTIVFSYFAKVPSDGIPYPIFAFSGLLFWTFFANSMMTATGSLVTNANLVRKIYFPREIMILAAIGAALVDLGVAIVVFIALMIYFQVPMLLTSIWVLPIFILQIILTVGLTLGSSCLNAFFRDIGAALPVALQIWLFASPVAYPISLVPERWRHIYMLNPMAAVIDGYKRALLLGQAPDLDGIAYVATVSLCVLACNYWLFKHAEASFADVV